jgi:hypothetical protein
VNSNFQKISEIHDHWDLRSLENRCGAAIRARPRVRFMSALAKPDLGF